MQQQVVLAYSGGLDTSVILKWLINKNYQVTAFVIDVGQNEDFAALEAKALQIGAHQVVVVDAREEFIKDYIIPTLQTGALYEGRYLLGTSLARPLIAKKLVEYAEAHEINNIAHGATGKGNDQVRFELPLLQFMTGVNIIAPWKDPEFISKFKGRTDLLYYASAQRIPVTTTIQNPYSIDENLLHTSYEAGILEDPILAPPEDMFRKTVAPQAAPDQSTELSIEFNKGVPVKVINHLDSTEISGNALLIFNYLNDLGGANAIGRIDIVESRFIGMKSRGVYETPAGTILHKAYQDLETLVLDREVLLLKALQAPKIAQLIYNGFWFSPELKMLLANNQAYNPWMNGIVKLALYKGNIIIQGRASPNSLYNAEMVTMDRLGHYDEQDARGFIRLQALRLKTSRLILTSKA
jgi:argininosuccinate synthase